jgi:hypothetical protein
MIRSERIRRLREWALARALEPSTIAGLLSAAATIGGWSMRPDLGPAIATIVSAAASVALVLTREDKP